MKIKKYNIKNYNSKLYKIPFRDKPINTYRKLFI